MLTKWLKSGLKVAFAAVFAIALPALAGCDEDHDHHRVRYDRDRHDYEFRENRERGEWHEGSRGEVHVEREGGHEVHTEGHR